MKSSFYVINPSQLVKEVKSTMAIEGFYLDKQEIDMLKNVPMDKCLLLI